MLTWIIKLTIINIGISVPIFFVLKWLLQKFNLGERARFYLSLFGAVTTPWITLIILIIVFIVSLFALTYYPKRDFNQAQWLSSPRTRYESADSLIERKLLIGKTKVEVKELLGNEEGKDEDYGGYRILNSESSNEWEYFIGFKPTPLRVDASFLEINFKDEKVTDVYLTTQ